MSESQSILNATASALINYIFHPAPPEGTTIGEHVPADVLKYLHPAWHR